MPPLQPEILRSSHIRAFDKGAPHLGRVALILEGAIHLKTCNIPPWELVGLKNPIWSCLPEGKVKMPPVPEKLAIALNEATSPKQIEQILAKWEKRIAHMCQSALEDYLPCYNANFLLSDVLQAKKISHKVVYGSTPDGAMDHVWVIADGTNYDVTGQGFGKISEIMYSYHYRKVKTWQRTFQHAASGLKRQLNS
jgi:hypothetical protein